MQHRISVKKSGAASAAVVGLALAVTACTAAPTTVTPAAAVSSPSAAPVTVFAAASLTEAFTVLGRAHTDETGVEVRFSFDGSSNLIDQIAGGAPADVLATADETSMQRAVDEGLLAGEPRLFASNVLTLVVPAGNPAGITGLDDSLAGARLVVCAPEVPCGRATGRVAELAGVTLVPVSEETSVTAVRGAVESGEADAGIVYVTDARAAGDEVEEIALPGAEQVVNRYPIALVQDAPQAAAADAFLEWVTGPEGQTILAEYGFRTP